MPSLHNSSLIWQSKGREYERSILAAWKPHCLHLDMSHMHLEPLLSKQCELAPAYMY